MPRKKHLEIRCNHPETIPNADQIPEGPPMPLPHRRGKPPYQSLLCNSWSNSGSSAGISNNGNSSRYQYPGTLDISTSANPGALIPAGPGTNNVPQPPFITDTLTACLDTNGTYLCTPYSPRCYIIQKVTPNAVTVTPHVPGSCVIPQAPGTTSTASNSWSSRFHTSRSKSYQSSSRRSSNDDPGGDGGDSGATTTEDSLQLNGSWVDHHRKHLPDKTPEPSSSTGPDITISSSCSSSSTPSPVPMAITVEPILVPPSISITTTGDSELMNGEVASMSGPSEEASMPSVGVSSNCAINSATGIRENEGKVVNGIEDVVIGMVEGGENTLSASANLEMSGLADPSQLAMCQEGGQEVSAGSNAARGNINIIGTIPDTLPLSEKRRMLLHQLEYYFSPENLANDKFLVSQMDSDHYVYISTLANFNMVKKLTSDLELITSVLKESKNVQVHPDGKRARPVTQRTVVILRGIPEKTPVEEIEALFENENCPKCNSCEFAFNDSWYISFESDEDAQKAHRYLREVVKEFKGQPIMARIKSRPTTLLSQSVNMHTMKNGYHPSPVIAAYAPFVPGTGAAVPGGAVAAAPVFGQQLPQVFPLPGFAGYAPQLTWPNYYEVAGAPLNGQLYLNGKASGPASAYPKGGTLGQRRNNSKYDSRVQGPRRMHSSNSESGGSSTGGAVGMRSHSSSHHYNSNHRKTNNNGAPQPLLGLPPMPLVSAHTSSHHHHHHSGSSIPVTSNSAGMNGRPYSNHMHQSATTNVHESYHQHRHRMESRPRSSLSARKGSRKDDDQSYETNSSQSTPTIRGNPSSRSALPQPGSPHHVSIGPTDSANANMASLKFDLASSAFPPLPGVTNAAEKNGDSPYEDRLADVVKGVKDVKILGPCSNEKEEETGPIVPSLKDSGASGNTNADIPLAAASAANLQYCEENTTSSHSKDVMESQKNFRDVGVGSADDSGDIRPTYNEAVKVLKGKETADKSTLIESTFLNGDQQIPLSGGGTTGSSSAGVPVNSSLPLALKKKSFIQSSVPPPSMSRKVIPVVQDSVSSEAAACPGDVPYSTKPTNMSSPSKALGSNGNMISKTAITANAVFSASMSNSRGNGANNSSIIKPGNPSVSTFGVKSSSANSSSTLSASVSTSDHEAFPIPGFAKSVPIVAKPFSGLTDHLPKENTELIDKNEGEKAAEKNASRNDENNCSNDEGPVRLSYAQVAQAKNEKAGASQVVQPPANSPGCNQNASLRTSPVTTDVPTTSGASDDSKKKNVKDPKDRRGPAPKNGRSNSGHITERERTERSDRDRNFRRDRPKNAGKR